MRSLFLTGLLLVFSLSRLHSQYQTPSNDLPEKLVDLKRAMEVSHFPKVLDPVEDRKEKGLYHWKHNTAVLSRTSDITIEEFGAYIYYNEQWNHRVTFQAKKMNKMFGTKKATLLQGQPYTFVNNWRSGKDVRGGWAMWYFIGRDQSGNRVCGYEMLETTENILK